MSIWSIMGLWQLCWLSSVCPSRHSLLFCLLVCTWEAALSGCSSLGLSWPPGFGLVQPWKVKRRGRAGVLSLLLSLFQCGTGCAVTVNTQLPQGSSLSHFSSLQPSIKLIFPSPSHPWTLKACHYQLQWATASPGGP